MPCQIVILRHKTWIFHTIVRLFVSSTSQPGIQENDTGSCTCALCGVLPSIDTKNGRQTLYIDFTFIYTDSYSCLCLLHYYFRFILSSSSWMSPSIIVFLKVFPWKEIVMCSIHSLCIISHQSFTFIIVYPIGRISASTVEVHLFALCDICFSMLEAQSVSFHQASSWATFIPFTANRFRSHKG